MKRVAVVIALAFTCLIAGETHFRETTWGMTPAEVKDTEQSIPLTLDGRLVFEVEVASLQTYAIFLFTDGELSEGRYVFDEKYADPAVYMDNYQKIHEILSEKYGEPTSHIADWTNRLYAKDEKMWGAALAMGHWSAVVSWDTSDTRITMTLKGGSFGVAHTVTYLSTTLQARAEAEQKKKAADDF